MSLARFSLKKIIDLSARYFVEFGGDLQAASPPSQLAIAHGEPGEDENAGYAHQPRKHILHIDSPLVVSGTLLAKVARHGPRYQIVVVVLASAQRTGATSRFFALKSALASPLDEMS